MSRSADTVGAVEENRAAPPGWRAPLQSSARVGQSPMPAATVSPRPSFEWLLLYTK